MAKKKATKKAPRSTPAVTRPRKPVATTGRIAGVEILTVAGQVPLTREPSERKRLQQLAMIWQYRLQNRERWVGNERASAEMHKEAADHLAEWGYGPQAVEVMNGADVIEVRIPMAANPGADDDTWHVRVLPWEFLIAAATRNQRKSGSLTVVRQLVRPRTPPQRRTIKTPKLLILNSSPGPLADEYDFSQERALIQAMCGVAVGAEGCLESPTVSKLAQTMGELAPDIVHVSAVDTRLAFDLLRRQSPGREPAEEDDDRPIPASTATRREWQKDGIVLQGTGSKPVEVVPAEKLAELLTGAGRKPVVVGLNVWHSASRIAPLIVAGGVECAIGFQSSFGDAAAELFFATFYATLKQNQWSNPLLAFRAAWAALAMQPESLTGTGVVLWSAHSLLDQIGAPSAPPPAERGLSVQAARDSVSFEIAPIARMNYALLHNNRSMFTSFTIRKATSDVLRDVRIEVQLYVGADSSPYTRTFDLVLPTTELKREIRVPLTSALSRRVDENMRTCIRVKIACADDVLYEDTHRVTLLPIDLWKFSDEEWQWLPCFVLPRDPAIVRIIQSAQQLLACLADDVGAGFDGYQSTDPSSDEPDAGVDRQVRAIWTALTLSLPLSYINPPPSYEPESQRLRTPTQILASGHGTCIDLSLLLAACLEYVGIYSAIVLLKGHAFPAYWRSEAAYSTFSELRFESDSPPVETEFGSQVPAPWVVGYAGYREIIEHVQQGRLVPLESTLLTAKSGFQAALDQGRENLRSRREFDGLVDIQRARAESTNPVTPLPLGDLS